MKTQISFWEFSETGHTLLALSNFLALHFSRMACLQFSLPTLCCGPSPSEPSPLFWLPASSHLLGPCRYRSLCLTIPSHHPPYLLLSILQPSAKDTAHKVIRNSPPLGLGVTSEFSSSPSNWSLSHQDKFSLFHKTQPRHLLFFASTLSLSPREADTASLVNHERKAMAVVALKLQWQDLSTYSLFWPGSNISFLLNMKRCLLT